MTQKLELTPQITTEIETLLMNGTPLTSICKTKGSPSLSKVYEWIRTDKAFAERILTARRIAAQTYLDKMIEELEGANNQNITVVREKLHHYRWMSSKLIPIYGDKVEQKIDQRIEINWNTSDDTDVIDLGSRDMTNKGSHTT
jgi:hypothetical protein|tara:strand:- start:553 stop:981 length:429 start_codon:yes stop_codon:yes gene_type:complete